MTIVKKKNSNAHPEGLSDPEEKLADLLIETKIEAKVRRRSQSADGSYLFTEVVRPTSPVDFAQEGEFALKLHETRPEAPLSPIYINLRNLPENVLEHVGQVLAEVPIEEKPDFCAGIPKAGLPLAQAFSRFSGLEVQDIFEKVQTEAGRRIVAGEKVGQKGNTLRLIDDLVTRAETKMEAIKAAETSGYEVTDILVLVDREQGGVNQLKEAGYKVKSAFRLSQLLDYYLRTRKINQAKYDEVMVYLAANR